MKKSAWRSFFFIAGFYIWTAFGCIVFIPGLALPRRKFTFIVHIWLKGIEFLERHVMDLHYELRGLENLPKQGAYIVAAKHQSAYETFKLRLLFDDPAIVLKKELVQVPLWGAYLKKSGVIALDRSTRDKALRSLEQGALQIAAEGRPIVIFPQGTRVAPNQTPAQKPYKPGAARIQAITNLPVIPMALNSGLFWPKGSWLKSPGTVIFEFLPPINPVFERREFMQILEHHLEGASNALMNEARAEEINRPARSKAPLLAVLLLAGLFGLYSWAWFAAAEEVRRSYISFMQDASESRRVHTAPVITGYPGPIQVRIAEDLLANNEGSLKIENIELRGWPIPLLPVHLATGPVTIRSYRWPEPIILDTVQARFSYFRQHLRIYDLDIHKGLFHGNAQGLVDVREEPAPVFDLTLRLKNHEEFLGYLAAEKIIKPQQALLATAGLNVFRNQEGVAEVPITQRGTKLYAGPLAIAEIPSASFTRRSAAATEAPPDQAP